MPRRSGGSKRRGIQVGVRKHRISNPTELLAFNDDPAYSSPKGQKLQLALNILENLGLDQSKLESLAAFLSSLIFQACHTLHLLPIFRTVDRKYLVKTGFSSYSHRFVLAVGLLISIQKFIACLVMFQSSTEFSAVNKIAGLSLFAVHFCGWLFSWSVILQPQETADALNGWQSLQRILMVETGRAVTEFTDVGATLKYIAVVIITTWVALAVGAATVVLKPLPVFWVHSAAKLGLFPPSHMSWLPMKMLFFPLEMVVSLSLMIPSAFSVGTLVLGIGLHKVFANAIR